MNVMDRLRWIHLHRKCESLGLSPSKQRSVVPVGINSRKTMSARESLLSSSGLFWASEMPLQNKIRMFFGPVFD